MKQDHDPDVVVYMDDVLVTGEDEPSNLWNFGAETTSRGKVVFNSKCTLMALVCISFRTPD